MRHMLIENRKTRELVATLKLLSPGTFPLSSRETGFRHGSADKFAKQTGHIVLAVSQSKNSLTLYLKNQCYI